LAYTAIVSLTTHASRLQPRDMVEGADTNLIGTNRLDKEYRIELEFLTKLKLCNVGAKAKEILN